MATVTVLPTQAQSADAEQDLIEVVSATPPRRVTGFAPGDSVNWAVTVRSVVRDELPVSIAVIAPDTEAARDPERGFRIRADLCDREWTELRDPVTDAPTYRCDGTTTSLFDGAAALDVGRAADTTLTLPPGGSASVRVVATLSPLAGDELEFVEFGELRLVATATLAGDASTTVLSAVEDPQSDSDERSRVLGRFALTGATVWPLLVAGAVLLVVGGMLLFAGRRRREQDSVTS